MVRLHVIAMSSKWALVRLAVLGNAVSRRVCVISSVWVTRGGLTTYTAERYCFVIAYVGVPSALHNSFVGAGFSSCSFGAPGMSGLVVA